MQESVPTQLGHSSQSVAPKAVLGRSPAGHGPQVKPNSRVPVGQSSHIGAPPAFTAGMLPVAHSVHTAPAPDAGVPSCPVTDREGHGSHTPGWSAAPTVLMGHVVHAVPPCSKAGHTAQPVAGSHPTMEAGGVVGAAFFAQ